MNIRQHAYVNSLASGRHILNTPPRELVVNENLWSTRTRGQRQSDAHVIKNKPVVVVNARAMHMQMDIYIYIWDSSRQNEPSYIYIKCYKIPLCLNRYNF